MLLLLPFPLFQASKPAGITRAPSPELPRPLSILPARGLLLLLMFSLLQASKPGEITRAPSLELSRPLSILPADGGATTGVRISSAKWAISSGGMARAATMAGPGPTSSRGGLRAARSSAAGLMSLTARLCITARCPSRSSPLISCGPSTGPGDLAGASGAASLIFPPGGKSPKGSSKGNNLLFRLAEAANFLFSPPSSLPLL